MKILFPYMARWKAVNWTRYHSIFDALAKAGHEILVLQTPAARSKETNFQEIAAELPKNIKLLDVNLNERLWNLNLPLSKIFKKGYYSLACTKEIQALVKFEKFDAIFLYNIPQYPLLRFNECIRIFDIADDYISMLGHELGLLENFATLRLAQRILNKMIEECDLTIAVSNVLCKSSIRNVCVLPNGVDIEKMKQSKDISVRFQKNGPVVGFVGSFEYFIDFDLILNVIEAMPEVTFLMVGTGREWEKVVNAGKAKGLRNVLFTGGVSHQEIFAYINKMDICLNIFKKIPVSHGACPLKLFEYLAMKKPVVSTRLDELAYVDKGFIYFADTPQEIIGQVRRILENKDETFERVVNGFSEVERNYTWQSIASRLVDLLEKKTFALKN